MAERRALRVGGVFDPSSGTVSGAATIEVEDGLVVAVRDGGGEAEKYDDLVAVPGLVDAHTHFSIETPGDERAQVARPVEERVLHATRFAERMLAEGVTTVRSLGEPGWLDVRLRDAGAALWRGPHIQASGRIVAPSHANVSVVDAPADGDEVVVRVRENVAQRVDWIKVYATASSLLGNPTESYFAREEILAIGAAAGRAGVPVAAHAHGGEAVDHCLEAGYATIEHGRFLSDSQLERMAAQGTTLCATVGVNVFSDQRRTGRSVDDSLRETEQSVSRAIAAGVRVVPGTDAVHGRLRFELRALEHFGLSRARAWSAATVDAAEVLGLAGTVGRIAPGYRADIALVAGDPLADGELPPVALTLVAGRDAWRAPDAVRDRSPA
jgi:imidazolonepropionase-like amidohydrolase